MIRYLQVQELLKECGLNKPIDKKARYVVGYTVDYDTVTVRMYTGEIIEIDTGEFCEYINDISERPGYMDLVNIQGEIVHEWLELYLRWELGMYSVDFI